MLIMLLIVLPFQMTWAAAAQYCQHEVSAQASHFGHHAHQHQSSGQVASKQPANDQLSSNDPSQFKDQTQSKSDTTGNAFNDSDCPYCHLGSMSSMVTVIIMSVQNMGITTAYAPLYPYPAISPTQPERPNWTVAL